MIKLGWECLERFGAVYIDGKEIGEIKEMNLEKPSCHRHNMPNDLCYGKPYLKDGGIPKKCHKCKWFAFGSERRAADAGREENNNAM